LASYPSTHLSNRRECSDSGTLGGLRGLRRPAVHARDSGAFQFWGQGKDFTAETRSTRSLPSLWRCVGTFERWNVCAHYTWKLNFSAQWVSCRSTLHAPRFSPLRLCGKTILTPKLKCTPRFTSFDNKVKLL